MQNEKITIRKLQTLRMVGGIKKHNEVFRSLAISVKKDEEMRVLCYIDNLPTWLLKELVCREPKDVNDLIRDACLIYRTLGKNSSNNEKKRNYNVGEEKSGIENNIAINKADYFGQGIWIKCHKKQGIATNCPERGKINGFEKKIYMKKNMLILKEEGVDDDNQR
jgi:hypothetical protein